MVNNGARELGNMIAGLANRQSRTEENLTGDDATGGLLIFGSDEVVIDCSSSVDKKTIEGVMIVGHSVYGEVHAYPIYYPIILGHSVYGLLGVGYLTYEKEVFTMTFPLQFGDGIFYETTNLFSDSC